MKITTFVVRLPEGVTLEVRLREENE